MRFLIIIKATKDSEAGVMPSEQLLSEMGKFNEELVQAGVMLAGEGLHPSSRGARVKFSGNQRTVMNGPLCRDQGTDRRVLVVAMSVERGRHQLGEALSQPDAWRGLGDRDSTGLRGGRLRC